MTAEKVGMGVAATPPSDCAPDLGIPSALRPCPTWAGGMAAPAVARKGIADLVQPVDCESASGLSEGSQNALDLVTTNTGGDTGDKMRTLVYPQDWRQAAWLSHVVGRLDVTARSPGRPQRSQRSHRS